MGRESEFCTVYSILQSCGEHQFMQTVICCPDTSAHPSCVLGHATLQLFPVIFLPFTNALDISSYQSTLRESP